MRKLLLIQTTITVLLAAALAAAVRDAGVGLAGLFGGAIAVANSALLAWRRAQVERLPPNDARGSLRLAWTSALERFVLVASLFAIGLGPLSLRGWPMLLVFAAGQLAYLISGFGYGNRHSCQVRP